MRGDDDTEIGRERPDSADQSPCGRPLAPVSQRLPAAERKAQITSAAVRVFARHGYRGATTRGIAAEAGVAEALLYRYFDSKEELFLAAVERTAGRIVAGARQIIDANADRPHQALAAMLEFAKGLLQRNDTLAKMVFIVNAELDDASVRATYLPYQDAILDLLTDTIAGWQKRSLLPRRLPPRATAWLLLGTFEVVALMKLSGRLHELDGPQALEIVRRVLGDPPGGSPT